MPRSVKPISLAILTVCVYGCANQAPTYLPEATTRHVVRTNVRVNPANPPLRLDVYYPAESRRLHEEGVCVVKITVNADASFGDMYLARSTGYPRLDEACLNAFHSGDFLPATEDGVPVTTTAEIPITWKLAAEHKQ